MRIFIIDSHVLFRQGVVRRFADYPDFEIVGESDTLSEGSKKFAISIQIPFLKVSALKSSYGKQVASLYLPGDKIRT